MRPIALHPILILVSVTGLGPSGSGPPCRLGGDLVLALGGAGLGSGGSALSPLLLLTPAGGPLVGGGGWFGGLLGRQQLLHHIFEGTLKVEGIA